MDWIRLLKAIGLLALFIGVALTLIFLLVFYTVWTLIGLSALGAGFFLFMTYHTLPPTNPRGSNDRVS